MINQIIAYLLLCKNDVYFIRRIILLRNTINWIKQIHHAQINNLTPHLNASLIGMAHS